MPQAITFDCYGTLVDWEKGIKDFLRSSLNLDQDMAEWFMHAWEKEQFKELFEGYKSYREISLRALKKVLDRMSVSYTDQIFNQFYNSITEWPLFDDLHELTKLSPTLKKGILSNMDTEMLCKTTERFPFKINFFISAEQVKSYKPVVLYFREAIKILGCKPAEILHCAFGFYYDIIPAKSLGIKTVLVNRKGEKLHKVADFEVNNLHELVVLVESLAI